MAAASGDGAALPWGRPTLAAGSQLEVCVVAGAARGGWIQAVVSEVHDLEHEYTLRMDWGDASNGEGHGGAAGAAATAAAVPGVAPAAAHTEAAAVTAGAEEEQEDEKDEWEEVTGEEVEGEGEEDTDDEMAEPLPAEVRVRILSDSTLQVLDGEDGSRDGGSSDGGSNGESGISLEDDTFEWRPAATSLQELFERALLQLAAAEQARIGGGGVIPSVAHLASQMEKGLQEVVTRATDHAIAAGTTIITADMVTAAFAEVTREMGLTPSPPPPPGAS